MAERVHGDVGSRIDSTCLQSPALHQYILETSVYPREPSPLRELREMTANLPWGVLAISPDQGQFMMLLIKLINAKRAIELGVFTGYSLLQTALALPHDGKVIAIDIDRKNYELGEPFIKKAGVHHKIDFREGAGIDVLTNLLKSESNLDSFDFVFVDADKENYGNYHEMLLKLVKVGGLIVYDNTLWFGSVASPDDSSLHPLARKQRPFVLEHNKMLADDSRVEISLVSVGDGMTICRRIK